MAEDFSRNRQYEYKANSNLVLEADRDGLRRAKDEASGEVETMHGKTEKLRMGDRLVYEKIQPSVKAEHKPKPKRGYEEEAITGINKKKKRENKNILAGTDDLDSINYRPKTRETRIAYEELLSMIQVYNLFDPECYINVSYLRIEDVLVHVDVTIFNSCRLLLEINPKIYSVELPMKFCSF